MVLVLLLIARRICHNTILMALLTFSCLWMRRIGSVPLLLILSKKLKSKELPPGYARIITALPRQRNTIACEEELCWIHCRQAAVTCCLWARLCSFMESWVSARYHAVHSRREWWNQLWFWAPNTFPATSSSRTWWRRLYITLLILYLCKLDNNKRLYMAQLMSPTKYLRTS